MPRDNHINEGKTARISSRITPSADAALEKAIAGTPLTKQDAICNAVVEWLERATAKKVSALSQNNYNESVDNYEKKEEYLKLQRLLQEISERVAAASTLLAPGVIVDTAVPVQAAETHSNRSIPIEEQSAEQITADSQDRLARGKSLIKKARDITEDRGRGGKSAQGGK